MPTQEVRVPAIWKDHKSTYIWLLLTSIRGGEGSMNPFKYYIGGFHATAQMLSFLGTRREVCQILQKLCHESRAYIVEQESLPGFLVHKPSSLGWFRYLKNIGSFEEKCKAHKIGNPETFLKTLEAMENNEEREFYLKEHHTILFIQSLKAVKRDDELQEFCKGLRENYKLFTFYIQHYLLPWFESLRHQGRLKKGTTMHFKS